MNKKGQALVEFILILPVFIFLIFSVYDFGIIFNKKNALENISTDIIELYKNSYFCNYPKCCILAVNSVL